MIKVTNRNAFDFNDRYNGQDFKIPAGKTVAIGEDAARHFFGLGDGDKQPYLVRQGWMTNSGQLADAMQKLNNFAFDMVDDLVPGEVVEEVAETEQGSAPLQPEPVEEPEPGGSEEPTGSTLDAQPEVPVLLDQGNGGKRSILDQLGGA